RVLAFMALAAVGVAGVEFSLAAAHWRPKGMARTMILSSSPMVLAVFVGNTSPLLLLGWAGAWLAMERGLPEVAGLLLALLWLKPSVGILAAAALLVAGPARRGRTALAFGVAPLALAGLDLVTSGLGPLVDWLGALTGYAGSLSSVAGRTAFSSNAGELAGLPGAFLDHVSAMAAVVLAAVLLATLLWLRLRGRWAGLVADRPARLAVAMAAALAISPYLHLNDLILEVAPLTLIASVGLTGWSRVALFLWTAGALLNLVVTVVVVSVTHGQLHPSSFGYGVVLNAATLLAVLAATRRRLASPASTRYPGAAR
ncbi:MAG TPA: glycosyltransferase 87 family protein, partial [Candidatus Dormibacteraeota bacterium]